MAKWLDTLETDFEAHPAQFTHAEDVVKFIKGGNAIFTLVSKKTGVRFTYRVKAVAEDRRQGPVSHFVSLLTGADNEGDYTYLGQFYNDRTDYRHGRKSSISQDAPSAKAIAWLCHLLLDGATLPQTLEVWHEARCGRCARKLTVPTSISSGFGPECINHV